MIFMYFYHIYNHQYNKLYYEFFEKIVDYIKIAKSDESTTGFPNAETGCNNAMKSFEYYFTDKKRAKIICKEFIKLYNSLDDCKSTSNSDPHRKCSKFLNYWINFKLGEIMQNDDKSFCNVYNSIESQFTGGSEIVLNLSFIYHIDKDELDKMSILYRLYKNYTDLDGILENAANDVKVKSLSLSTACCKDYLEARYICDTSKNNSGSRFCEKLKDFKSKYDQLDGKVNKQGSDFSNYFIKLSECPNNQIITTAVTGSIVGLIPLFGILYKVSELYIKQ
ncbi:hypothetical protein PVMG_05592 [Plasmodium vivax Mauritania I]|uniref:Variable surface protein Vir7-like protein n=1 Tax=Plasmodium vivax Mauritania I TaxID=1035515 RepID=A0A0J9THH0_PLAVI|nr:hypothetical protein PVMG_05592 [Plasmodium vivax Mauritania I]